MYFGLPTSFAQSLGSFLMPLFFLCCDLVTFHYPLDDLQHTLKLFSAIISTMLTGLSEILTYQ